MTSKLIEEQALTASVLRIATSDLTDVPEHVLDQELSMCILNDLSPLDLSNKSVRAFVKFITSMEPEMVTVREIRDSARGRLTRRPHSLVANEWLWVDIGNDSRKVLFSNLQGDDAKHINQLLRYIGGKSIEESYQVAINHIPKYHVGTEYNRVSYSLGINYTYFDNSDYTESGKITCKHSDKNMLRLLSNSRLSMQEELAFLVHYGHDPDDYAHADIHYISIYMNDIEIFQIQIEADADDMYEQDMDLISLLPTAKVLIEGDNFKDILLSGELLKSKDYRWLANRLKGRHLETELGM